MWFKAALRRARSLAGRLRRSLSSAPPLARPVLGKAYKRESSANLYDGIDFLRALELRRLHTALEERIRRRVAGGHPLRVGFLVNDRSKWNAGSLVEQIRTRGWEPRLYLCLTDLPGLDANERRTAYLREREFFNDIDPDLVDLYDVEVDNAIPVETIETDILFYQQPWGMKDFPRRMAGRALGAYMHYGFMLMANHGMHYNIATFHSYLWRYFTQTEEHRLLHLEHDPSAYERLVVTGYPKLDVYAKQTGDNPDRQHHIWEGADPVATRVIFAPHHSLGKDNLRMATFRWTSQLMLDLARKEPGLQWVYKPHPTLKHSVVRNEFMTREEYQRYEQQWQQLPNAAVYDSGGYFDIFKSSDVLITDCGSFLAEYLPTGNPIIWLISEESVGLNAVGEALAEAFYKVRDVEELQRTFRQLVMQRHDPLADSRARAAATLLPGGGNATAAVIDHLAATFPEPPARP